MTVPHWSAVMAIFAVSMLSAAACDDGDDMRSVPSNSTPQATASVPPTVTPADELQPPTAEEIGMIDQVVSLTLAGDEDGLRRLASGRLAPCETQHSGPGGGPVCRDGEPAGTRIEAIGVGTCDGSLARLEDVDMLPDDGPWKLVAAYRPRSAPQVSMLFDVLFDGPAGKFSFGVTAGGITSIIDRCETAAPIALGAGVVQWVIPPEYEPFALRGAFRGGIDEPGDFDPFVWQFPAATERTSREYRVYWQDAIVLACAEDRCGESELHGADAAARLTGFASGASICVRGWRDDVGNVRARLLTPGLAEDAPCELSMPATGIALIDGVIDAVQRKDAEALAVLVAYRPLGCVEVAQLSTPPQCEPGQPAGTMIDTLMVAGCDGGPRPRDEIHGVFRSTLDNNGLELYAVVRRLRAMDDETYRVIYTRPRDGEPMWVNLTQNGIVGLRVGCGPSSSERLAEGEIIIPPQFEAPAE